MVYERIEPFQSSVGQKELPAGIISSTIANFSQRQVKDEKTGERKLWAPKDFMPSLTKSEEVKDNKPKQSVEEMKLVIQGIVRSSKKSQPQKRITRKSNRRR